MRYAVYARVSSEDQAERGTIETQLDFAAKYCDLNGIKPVSIYKDDGISGTVPFNERPGGGQALNDARNGKYDILLLYRIDRLGRATRIILNAVHDLEQCGVTVRSMTEPFDTSDPSGRFLLTILSGVAELEREDILERMWHGANRAAREGKWLGGIVPYGYFVNDSGFLEISEEKMECGFSEADVVRFMYRLIAYEGKTTVDVANFLNALGIPPSYAKDNRMIKNGKRKENTAGIWRPSRIRNMIVNTTYKGIHQYGKRTNKKRELITRQVPAIVDEKTWETAVTNMHKNMWGSSRNAKHEYLLRGLIKCGICGRNYTGTTRVDKAYYKCGGKSAYHGPLPGGCKNSKNLPQKWIENLVWNDVVSFITNPGDVVQKLSKQAEDNRTGSIDYSERINTLQKSLENKDKEKQTILDLYRKGLLEQKDVEIQLKKIADEKIVLNEQIQALKDAVSLVDDTQKAIEQTINLLDLLKEKIEKGVDFKTKREVIELLVKEITVFSPVDKRELPKVSIKYRFGTIADRTGSHADTNCTYTITREEIVPLRLNKRSLIDNIPSSDDSIGARLKNLRITAGISLKEAANLAGLSVKGLRLVEQGNGCPRLSTVKKLADIYGVPFTELYSFKDLPENSTGERIRKIRLSMGLSQSAFAACIGVNPRTIEDWEADKHSPLPDYAKILDKLYVEYICPPS